MAAPKESAPGEREAVGRLQVPRREDCRTVVCVCCAVRALALYRGCTRSDSGFARAEELPRTVVWEVGG